MQRIEAIALPRSPTARALMVTALYAMFAYITLHLPIASQAPMARLFGTPDLAREAMVQFAQALFWPVTVLVALTALRSSLGSLRKPAE